MFVRRPAIGFPSAFSTSTNSPPSAPPGSFTVQPAG